MPASERLRVTAAHLPGPSRAAAAEPQGAVSAFRVGKSLVPLDGRRLGLMEPANHLLSDGEKLAKQMARNGYLYLKGVLPKAAVEQARARVARGVEEAAGADASLGHFFLGGTSWHEDSDVAPCVEHERLHEIFDTLFGRRSATLDYKWVRAAPSDGWSGFHTDSVREIDSLSS